MKTHNVNGTVISHSEEIPIAECLEYINQIQRKLSKDILSADITLDGEYVDIKYTTRGVPFERIRRITGYLVGTTDRWNGAKQAEEKDRVKHIEHLGGLDD